MRKNFFLGLLLLVVSQATAQIMVSGTVIDANSKEGLPSANVYVNNTSIGVFTDSLGKFKMSVPNTGSIDLIVSHLAYQKKTLMVLPGASERLTIEMIPKDYTLNEVIIQGKKNSPATIRNWIDLFSITLIGNYPEVSSQCRITNPEVLHFYYNKLTNDLNVFARSPLLIENLALGYLIRLELDQFVYNFRQHDVLFKYSLFFENLVMSDIRMEQVMKRRKSIYTGSNMHFMRALFNDSVEAEGFSIYKYTSVKNMERARVELAIRQRVEYMYANRANPDIRLERLFSSIDTTDYYQSVLKQNNVIRFDTIKVSSRKLSSPNSDHSLVNFNSTDTLMIRFQNVVSNKGWANSLPSQHTVRRVQKKTSVEQTVTRTFDFHSYLFFISKVGVNIDSAGYYPEMGIFVYGDMSERRLAGALPFDYDSKDQP